MGLMVWVDITPTSLCAVEGMPRISEGHCKHDLIAQLAAIRQSHTHTTWYLFTRNNNKMLYVI